LETENISKAFTRAAPKIISEKRLRRTRIDPASVLMAMRMSGEMEGIYLGRAHFSARLSE